MDVKNVMHVKYSKVHDVHAFLWEISCNKTFIIWPLMLADKYHGQTNHVFLNHTRLHIVATSNENYTNKTQNDGI